FLCVDVDAGRTETLVWQASAVQREWLPPRQLNVTVEVSFNPASERISARRRLRYEDLVLEDKPAAVPDEDQAAAILAAAAAEHLDRVFPPADSPAHRYLTRLRCLRQWMPELQLPSCDDADLRAMLPAMCDGSRSFADLRKANWKESLDARLTPRQRQAVER